MYSIYSNNEFIMDQLNAMRTFVRVVQSGSFSAAAREQNSSQATVSKKIAALENRLGVKLIARTSREQSLTQAGAEYHEYCVAMLTELEEVEARVRSRTTTPQGLLRIAVAVPLGRLVLAPLIVEFLAENPDMQVDLSVDERHVDLVAEGIDIAIRARALEDSTLIARPLFENPLLLLASPDYLKRNGEPRTPADLKNHDCIVYTLMKSLNNWHFSRGDTETTVAVSGPCRSSSSETNLQMALSGAGIVHAPMWMVREYLQQGRLVQVLKDYRAPNIPINIVYPQNRHVPLKVRCFVDFLREKLDGFDA